MASTRVWAATFPVEMHDPAANFLTAEAYDHAPGPHRACQGGGREPGPGAVVAQSALEYADVHQPVRLHAQRARVPDAGPAGNLQRRLIRERATVRYHGDFDWPGVGIAGRILAAGALPWRMSAHDYRSALDNLSLDSRLALVGSPSVTTWELALGVAMRERGIAGHEESILSSLLDDLGPPPTPRIGLVSSDAGGTTPATAALPLRATRPQASQKPLHGLV